MVACLDARNCLKLFDQASNFLQFSSGLQDKDDNWLTCQIRLIFMSIMIFQDLYFWNTCNNGMTYHIGNLLFRETSSYEKKDLMYYEQKDLHSLKSVTSYARYDKYIHSKNINIINAHISACQKIIWSNNVICT